MPSYSKTIALPGKTAQELYEKISTGIDQFMNHPSLSMIGKFDLHRDPAKQEVSFKASMAEATLHCFDGKIELTGKLSLLATPFKGKIDHAIESWASKHLA